jgi:transporter family-2 protein
MTRLTALLWLLALVAGALIPVQAAANATLSRSLQGNVAFSALILFAVAALTTLAALALSRAPLPPLAGLRAAPWWAYIGGAIVATYVLTITFLAPRLGVGSAIALIVTGQIVAALLIDHFGLLRSNVVPVTPVRLLGGLLMVAGVFLALRR